MGVGGDLQSECWNMDKIIPNLLFTKKWDTREVSFSNRSLQYDTIDSERTIWELTGLVVGGWYTSLARIFCDGIAWKGLKFFPPLIGNPSPLNSGNLGFRMFWLKFLIDLRRQFIMYMYSQSQTTHKKALWFMYSFSGISIAVLVANNL